MRYVVGWFGLLFILNLFYLSDQLAALGFMLVVLLFPIAPPIVWLWQAAPTLLVYSLALLPAIAGWRSPSWRLPLTAVSAAFACSLAFLPGLIARREVNEYESLLAQNRLSIKARINPKTFLLMGKGLTYEGRCESLCTELLYQAGATSVYVRRGENTGFMKHSILRRESCHVDTYGNLSGNGCLSSDRVGEAVTDIRIRSASVSQYGKKARAFGFFPACQHNRPLALRNIAGVVRIEILEYDEPALELVERFDVLEGHIAPIPFHFNRIDCGQSGGKTGVASSYLDPHRETKRVLARRYGLKFD